MDLNQLYFDHQLLRIGADQATSHARRSALEADASQVAARIGSLQRRLRASAAVSWEVLAASRTSAQGCPA